MAIALVFMPFFDLLKKTVVSHATIQVLQELGKVIDRKHLISHEERNAMIEFWFHYDSEYQLLKIQLALDNAVKQLESHFNTGIARLEAALTYRQIDNGLYLVSHDLQAFLKADSVSRDHQKAQFLRAFDKYDPKGLLTLLHKDVTVNDAAGQFLHTLMKSCDYDSYEHWCDHIAINALRAYLCCMHQLNEVHAQDGGMLLLPQMVQTEVNLMAAKVEGILTALQESKHHSRRRIFNVNEDSQSELMNMVDKFMVHCEEEPMSNNQHCAEKFGKELSHMYPWFAWAVIIAEDSTSSKKSNFVMYSDDFQDDLFIQQSVHSQILPYITSSKVNRPAHEVLLSGGKAGMIICKKQVHCIGKIASRRKLIVMWTQLDTIVALSPEAEELLADIDVKHLAPEGKQNSIREQKKAWDVKQSVFENILFADGLQYVACVGVCGERAKNEVGTYVTENRDGAFWPYRIQNKTGQLFVWATKVTQKALDFRTRRSNLSIFNLMNALHPMAQPLMTVKESDKHPEGDFQQSTESETHNMKIETKEREDVSVLHNDTAAQQSMPEERMSFIDTLAFFERRPNVEGYRFAKK